MEYDVAHYGLEDGVAKKFQSFVVERASLAVTIYVGFVGKGDTINLEVAGIESEHTMECLAQFAVFLEVEFYAV